MGSCPRPLWRVAPAATLLPAPVKHDPGNLALATSQQEPRLASAIQAVVAQAHIDPGWATCELVGDSIIRAAVVTAAAWALAGVFTQVSSLTSSDLVSHFLSVTGFAPGVSLIAIATLAAVAVLIRCLAGLVRNAAALAFRALVELIIPLSDSLVLVAVVAVAALMLHPLIDNPTGNTLSTTEVLILFQGPLLALVRGAIALTCFFFVVWIAGAIASTVIRAGAQVESGAFIHFVRGRAQDGARERIRRPRARLSIVKFSCDSLYPSPETRANIQSAPTLAMTFCLFLGISIVVTHIIHNTALQCGCVWGFGVENVLPPPLLKLFP